MSKIFEKYFQMDNLIDKMGYRSHFLHQIVAIPQNLWHKKQAWSLFYPLEPSCCKRQQKKSQPRNWFEELGTSEGSKWYQIGPKRACHLGSIWYRLEPSETSPIWLFPIAVSWLRLFLAGSYSKTTLALYCEKWPKMTLFMSAGK